MFRSLSPLFAPPVLVKPAYETSRNRGGRPGFPLSGCGGRLLIMAVIVGFVLFRYFSLPTEVNKFTGREQKLNLDAKEEIQMGLASAPKMAQQFGGLSQDTRARALVERIGNKLVADTDADQTPYANNFNFYVLADRKTVNAFALPGGQIFITEALLNLLETEDEVAGVLGHEIGHVVGRHSSEQIAKQNLFGGLATAVAVGMGGDGSTDGAARIAQVVSQMATMKYGRDDELESDRLAVLFLLQAGYQPDAMIRVMQVLEKASGGAGRQPEIMSSHPNPGNRIGVIKEEIARRKAEGLDKLGGSGRPPILDAP